MNKQQRDFVALVYDYYHRAGRHGLPWRKTTDPYKIVVSEFMLQQTQVERVLPKYRAFLKQFPSARALARAPLFEVLIAWQGLGYNRRAKYLHQCASTIIYDSAGKWPTTYDGLKALPGIGPYTAGAVMAFAYNEAVPILETNVRAVLLHHFFPNRCDISEAELLACATAVLDTETPRLWYAALMDYGSYLKRTVGSNNYRAQSYTKQTKFAGSNRQLRGIIMSALCRQALTVRQLQIQTREFSTDAVQKQLDALLTEGLIVRRSSHFTLAP